MALKALNSVAGFSVGETPINVILANGDITTTNITTSGVTNLNSIANLVITGGSSGQVIQTDGLGNLSFVTIGTSSLNNGNSNITVLANGNILLSSAGNANVLVVTGSGANIDGTLSVSGNSNLSNLGTSGLITSSGNITGANLKTAGILSVGGNASVGGILTDNYYYANGSPVDFEQPAGTNTQIQFNNNNNFGASANFTFDTSTNKLTVTGSTSVTGNANIGNIGTGIVTASGNITGANIGTAGIISAGGNATVAGILTDNYYYANGSPVDFEQPAGTNTQIQFNNNNNFGASPNFTFDSGSNQLYVNGTISSTGTTTSGNLATAGTLSVGGNANVGNLGTGGLITATGNITGGNFNTSGLITATGNVQGNNVIGSNVFVSSLGSGQIAIGYTSGQLVGGPDLFWSFANADLFSTGFVSNRYVSATGNVTGGNLVTGGVVTATGNVTGGNITTGGAVSATGNVTGGNISTTGQLNAGNANISGTLVTYQEQLTSVTAQQVVYANGNSYLVGSANYTFNDSTNVLSVNGNVAASNVIATNAFIGNIQLTGDITVNSLTSNTFVTANGNVTGGNLVTGGIVTATGTITGGNLATGGTISAGGNANVANLGVTGVYSSTLSASGNASVGGILTDNYYYSNGSPVDFQQPAGSNTQIQFNNNNDFGATANFTFDTSTNLLTVNGNAQFNNANLGNVATANFVNVASNITSNNVTVNLELAGNTANFTGNVILTNANVTGSLNVNTASYSGNVTVPNLTVNLELAGNTANFTGNVVAANFIGSLANGNSEVKVYNNANVEFTIGGNANLVSITTTGLYVDGEIQTTAGNILSNGNVTANGFLNGANANVTGEGTFGSVVTANITAPVGNITISAVGVDQNIILSPTGNGVIDVGLHKIVQVGDPTNPHDAATKEYVDNVAQGIFVHTPVVVTTTTNLNATYANGGSSLTTTTITGNKTIQFSANHGLTVGDEIYWTSSFNGITAYNSYFVYSTPALNQITVKNGFNGAEVTTLTNGTGLSQPALANSGVGATLTNAGANAALQIDGVTLSSTDRVLVKGQTNGFENGIYTVTTVGAADSPGPGAQWVLTRATTEDTYDPKSTSGLAIGDYFFVEQGNNNKGSSYVLSSPTGEILFGYSSIGFTQFSESLVYTAGNGIAITGTTISANVDGVTTAIVGGNIVVKTSAQLTTPNIGDATGSSLTVTGNISANNISVANISNISSNLTVGGFIQANGNITSNGWVNANDIFVTGNISAQGNALIGNITSNGIMTASGNVTGGNLVTGGLVTATGNVTGGNITTGGLITAIGNITGGNIDTAGTLSVGGNANVGNLGTGGLITATGNITGGNLITGGILTATGNANVGNLGTGGIVTATGNITGGNLITAGYANVGTNLHIGNNSVNTTITWASVTTTSVTANQTIASFNVTGVTGVEYLVKGVDSTGDKYSVATVQAVTDGANVDYATFGTVQLGGYTGSLAVNISGGFIRLQVTPASSNSTVWTTQYRLI